MDRGGEEATNTVLDRGTARRREDHCRTAHRGRAGGTSFHEGRMGEGCLRENPPSAQDVIDGRLIQIGLRVLELGNKVVID